MDDDEEEFGVKVDSFLFLDKVFIFLGKGVVLEFSLIIFEVVFLML